MENESKEPINPVPPKTGRRWVIVAIVAVALATPICWWAYQHFFANNPKEIEFDFLIGYKSFRANNGYPAGTVMSESADGYAIWLSADGLGKIVADPNLTQLIMIDRLAAYDRSITDSLGTGFRLSGFEWLDKSLTNTSTSMSSAHLQVKDAVNESMVGNAEQLLRRLDLQTLKDMAEHIRAAKRPLVLITEVKKVGKAILEVSFNSSSSSVLGTKGEDGSVAPGAKAGNSKAIAFEDAYMGFKGLVIDSARVADLIRNAPPAKVYTTRTDTAIALGRLGPGAEPQFSLHGYRPGSVVDIAFELVAKEQMTLAPGNSYYFSVSLAVNDQGLAPCKKEYIMLEGTERPEPGCPYSAANVVVDQRGDINFFLKVDPESQGKRNGNVFGLGVDCTLDKLRVR